MPPEVALAASVTPVPAPMPANRAERLRAARISARLGRENAAKRAFLRMVSHELRTPLNAIIGFSEVLSNELYGPLGSPQYREYAEIVRSSGHQLLAMVNQILEIARLEGGAADLAPRSEPVGVALADALSEVRREAAHRSVTVDAPDLDDLPCVRADSRALATMLSALLENAVGFAPEGTRVEVSVRMLSGSVVVEIADEGVGCHPDDLPRLMRPFEQGEDAPARKTPGAGLALPIARLLAEASGGSLRLRAGHERGMTAVLSLPRA
jgi:signal transduction histidine kinase